MSKHTPAQVERQVDSAMNAYKERAAQVKAAHREARQKILDDVMLSEYAKQTRIEELDNKTRNELDVIRGEQSAYFRTLRGQLERELLGDQPSDANSVLLRRDAAERARRVADEGEALDVLRDAVRNGDETLAHAVGHRARHAGWADASDAYREAHPDKADSAVALAYVEDYTASGAYNLASQITYSAP